MSHAPSSHARTRLLRTAAVALPLLSPLLLGGCQTQLYTSLDQQDAMAMIAILLQHGINADRVIAKDGTSTIEVEGDRVADAVTLLRANRFPRTDYESMGDVFKQQGMISSPTAERARYDFGLSQELSRTMSDIDGVLTARVHIVLPDNDPLDGENRPSAAAVFIRYDSRVDVSRMLPQIKLMVADSVEGLTYDKVSVILLPVVLPAVATAPAAPAKDGGGIGWGEALALLGSLAGGGYAFWRARASLLPARFLPARFRPEHGARAPAHGVPVARLRRVS